LIVKTDKDIDLKAKIRLINQDLPMKIDEETVFYNVSLKNNNIYFRYTLINYSIEKIDLDSFRTIQMSNLKSGVCESEKLNNFLKEDYQLIYSYRDMNGTPILEFPVKLKDCFTRYESN